MRDMTERGGPGKLQPYWEQEIYIEHRKGRISLSMKLNQKLELQDHIFALQYESFMRGNQHSNR